MFAAKPQGLIEHIRENQDWLDGIQGALISSPKERAPSAQRNINLVPSRSTFGKQSIHLISTAAGGQDNFDLELTSKLFPNGA
jgi:hypothetical protein